MADDPSLVTYPELGAVLLLIADIHRLLIEGEVVPKDRLSQLLQARLTESVREGGGPREVQVLLTMRQALDLPESALGRLARSGAAGAAE